MNVSMKRCIQSFKLKRLYKLFNYNNKMLLHNYNKFYQFFHIFYTSMQKINDENDFFSLTIC